MQHRIAKHWFSPSYVARPVNKAARASGVVAASSWFNTLYYIVEQNPKKAKTVTRTRDGFNAALQGPARPPQRHDVFTGVSPA
jgi:hypothetical protein